MAKKFKKMKISKITLQSLTQYIYDDLVSSDYLSDDVVGVNKEYAIMIIHESLLDYFYTVKE